MYGRSREGSEGENFLWTPALTGHMQPVSRDDILPQASQFRHVLVLWFARNRPPKLSALFVMFPSSRYSSFHYTLCSQVVGVSPLVLLSAAYTTNKPQNDEPVTYVCSDTCCRVCAQLMSKRMN